MIEANSLTRRGPEDRGLGGSGFGGLVTRGVGLTQRQVFGKLAVHSPSVWWDKRVILETLRDLRERPSQRIWLDVGTNEGVRAQRDVRRLRDALRKKRWKLGQDLAYLEAEGAGPNEAAWAGRVAPILKWLFPPPPMLDP